MGAKGFLCLVLCAVAPAWSQVNYGEIRLKITDPSGSAVRAAVELICTGNGYDKSFLSDAAGNITIREIPYGVYQVQVRNPEFAPFSNAVEVRSALHLLEDVQLGLPLMCGERCARIL